MRICIEGIDGCGKTSLVNSLVPHIKNKRLSTAIEKYPDENNPVGKLIRQILNKEVEATPIALQMLFTAERYMRENESKHKITIMDRYFLSGIAYGSADGLDLDWLIEIHRHLKMPDITFILDIPVELSLERTGRGIQDKYESDREFLGRARAIYANIPQLSTFYGNRIVILDGSQEPNKVHEQAVEVLKDYLAKLI